MLGWEEGFEYMVEGFNYCQWSYLLSYYCVVLNKFF